MNIKRFMSLIIFFISLDSMAYLQKMPIISLQENETEVVDQVETAKLTSALSTWASLDQENFYLAEKEISLSPVSPLKLRRVRINLSFSAKVGLGPIFGIELLTRQVVIWSKKGE